MKISKMFEVLSKNNYQEYPVVVFTYENEYPVLFFTELLQKLAKDSEIILNGLPNTSIGAGYNSGSVNIVYITR